MKKLKEVGIFLLLVMNTILLGSTLLFFAHVSITPFHLPIFIIISGVLYYFFRKKSSKKELIQVILISLLIMLVSTGVSALMFDRSSDGNTYHKDAIGVLKEGFNPVYESSSDFIMNRKDDSKSLTEYSIWTDHYAKANWIIAANFYSLTGNIESGKAINLISITIAFALIFSTLVDILSKRKALVLSIITALNPITASQMFTYYNDQLVCLYLFLAILYLIKLDKNIKDKESWFGYILTFIILANMKFNGLGYLLVFSFLFVCRYLYKVYKKGQFFPIFKKLCTIFIPLFKMAKISLLLKNLKVF